MLSRLSAACDSRNCGDFSGLRHLCFCFQLFQSRAWYTMAVIQLVPSGTESGRDTDRSRATAVVSVIQDSDDPSDRMCSPVVMCAIENATIVFHSEDAGNVKDTSPPRNSRPETRRHPREMYLHMHRPGHSTVVLESVYARPRGRIGIMMIVILRKLEPGPALAGRVSSCAEGPSGGGHFQLCRKTISVCRSGGPLPSCHGESGFICRGATGFQLSLHTTLGPHGL